MDWLVGLTDGLVCACVCVFVLHGLQGDSIPLHSACKQSDNAAVVGLLLDRGADLHAQGLVRVNTHNQHMRFTLPSPCSALLMCGVVLHRALLELC